jgi:hypothetical protein
MEVKGSMVLVALSTFTGTTSEATSSLPLNIIFSVFLFCHVIPTFGGRCIPHIDITGIGRVFIPLHHQLTARTSNILSHLVSGSCKYSLWFSDQKIV